MISPKILSRIFIRFGRRSVRVVCSISYNGATSIRGTCADIRNDKMADSYFCIRNELFSLCSDTGFH